MTPCIHSRIYATEKKIGIECVSEEVIKGNNPKRITCELVCKKCPFYEAEKEKEIENDDDLVEDFIKNNVPFIVDGIFIKIKDILNEGFFLKTREKKAKELINDLFNKYDKQESNLTQTIIDIFSDMDNLIIEGGFILKTKKKKAKELLTKLYNSYNSNIPNIGDFYEGGYFFGTIEVNSITYGLVCADKVKGETHIEWGNCETETSTNSLIDGYKNTKYLIGSYPAADFCRNLTIGGYNNWYLPSKEELDLLFKNHAALESAGAGAFENDWYWSSTEYFSNNAWIQYFSNGTQTSDNKNNSYYVRAIKRFNIKRFKL